jgi:hypothetical protein
MNEPESETVWVRMGVLEADPGLRPSCHTWVDSAPAWLPVPEDGLPRYSRRSSYWHPGREALLTRVRPGLR